jgi:hypothetical protein
MFIRVYRRKEDREILLNVANIWKIEVQYAIPASEPGGMGFMVGLAEGINNPNAVRVYEVFAGSEQIRMVAEDPDDPVIKVLEQIYKDAIKGAGGKGQEG